MQGHLDGGRACLLAMRVSRSVLLSVCEAVIRFQDFPSVTGLLTKPYTPLHEDNRHNVTPLPPPPHTQPTPGLLHLSRQEPQSPAATPETCSLKLKILNLTNLSVSGANVE